MKVIISGGGTGGHIYPAIAILEEIKKEFVDSQILYIGSKNGLESEIIKGINIDFKSIEVKGMPRRLNLDLFKSFFALIKGLRQSSKIIKEFKPDLVIGTGGFVSFPIVYKATKKRIPTFIHEQNSVMGIANKILSRYVDKIGITFDEASKYVKNKNKINIVGNPVRRKFYLQKIKDYDFFGLDSNKKTILIFGGSNGHKNLNVATAYLIEKYLGNDKVQIIHATGKNLYNNFINKVNGDLSENIKIYPYLNNIIKAYSIADLIVTSSGAMTLAEIAACGLPAILIPKAYTTENHQVYNALAIEKRNAAKVILESDLNGETLYKNINELISDNNKLDLMKKKSKELSKENSAQEIIKILKKLVKK